MKIKKGLGAGLAMAGIAALAMTVTAPAHADTNAGSTTTLAVTGSDTTQDVMEGLSNVIKVNNAPVLSNYLAIPVGRTITTRTGNANCTFVAPKNSGEGTDALSAAMRGQSFSTSTNMTGCVNVARSSGGANPTTSPGVGSMTYIPFATDAVTYAVQAASVVPKALNKADLIAIYTANTGSCIFEPLIPAAGSGTRSFFRGFLGLTSDTIGAAGGWGTCVKDTVNGQSVQEHDGRFLTNGNQLVPISVGQFIAQASGTINDLRGSASLGAVDFTAGGVTGTDNATSPLLMQTNFGTATRQVYNVVPTTETTNGSLTQQVFVGANSLVCQNLATINKYGFGAATSCGDTTKKNTN